MKILNISILFALILLTSCFSKSKNSTWSSTIINDLSGVYLNKPIAKSKESTSLLNLLGIYNVDADTVTISFTNDKMYLSYAGRSRILGKELEGKFSRSGYYQVYLQKERFIIPIFYSNINVCRIRLRLYDNELLVETYTNNTSSIFILASGGRGKTRNNFIKIK